MSLNQIPDFMLSDEAGNVKDKIAVLSGVGGAVEKANKSEFDEYKADNASELLELENKKADVIYVDTKVDTMTTGTPKIVVQSIVNLPTIGGVEKLALVLDDGHKYYDNGVVWVDSGVYQSVEPSNESVTVKKIDSKIYDAIDILIPAWAVGTVTIATGAEAVSDKYIRTGFLSLGNRIITVNPKTGYKIFVMCYGEDYSYKTYSTYTTKTTFTPLYKYYRFVISTTDSLTILSASASDNVVISTTNPEIEWYKTNNLYNGSQLILGGYYNGSGIFQASSVYNSSPLLPCVEGGKVYSSEFKQINGSRVCFFNGSTFVSEIAPADTKGKECVIVPSGANKFVLMVYVTSTVEVRFIYTEFRISVKLKEMEEYLNSVVAPIIVPPTVVDLVIFMGQSNMAGRGENLALATICPNDYGYEFRAITDPTKLYSVAEPFGINENVVGAINDVAAVKTGGMVASLIKEYYLRTKVPVVGVSASEGSTSVIHFQPGTTRMIDAKNRFNLAKNWLESNGYTIRHKYMVWDQGETDYEMVASTYKDYLALTIEDMMTLGVEKCFLVRTGDRQMDETIYDAMIDAQTEFCQTYTNVTMASVIAASFNNLGIMKDIQHYTQVAYNLLGQDAGRNIAFYTNNGKEPTMYDSENANLYYSFKS